jgi:hypothetical protein
METKPKKTFYDESLHTKQFGKCPWCKEAHAEKCFYYRPVPTISTPIFFNFKKKYDAK